MNMPPVTKLIAPTIEWDLIVYEKRYELSMPGMKLYKEPFTKSSTECMYIMY